MSGGTSRRAFLQRSVTAGTLSGMFDLGFLSALNPVSAAEARPDPNTVRFLPETESTVRLLEETSRDQLLEVVGRRVRDGLSYRELVSALLLAGIRNIEPRPDVGFKFHGVLVVNAAHLASLASPAEHRWLPIFWALDYFKRTQAAQLQQRPWTMKAVDESALVRSDRARQAFIDAMDRWDEAAADAAVTSLVRTAGAQEIFELFFRYGVRDFHDWHHAIFTANCKRLIDCVGWQHAEPILRSLTYALLSRDRTAASGEVISERPWRTNQERLENWRADWPEGRIDSAATDDLLATLRSGSPDHAAEKLISLSQSGISPQSMWDAMLIRAVELLHCQRGFAALHAVTTTNAMRYLYQQSGDDRTRRLVLLQAASFLVLFREAMHGDVRRAGPVSESDLLKLEPAPLTTRGEEQVGEILAAVSTDRKLAARQMLTFAKEHPEPIQLIAAARAMVFLKSDEPHGYKFTEAIFEDYRHVSPAWRDRFLAGSVYWLSGSAGPDNALVDKTRAALKG